MKPLPIHPLAKLLPAMSAEEFQTLKADIAVHGQREPITLLDGKVLDGRHRERACRELGIQPRTREWDRKGSPIDFVVSANLLRRHLSKGQLAAAAVMIEGQFALEARDRMLAGKKFDPKGRFSGIAGKKGHSRELAGRMVGVSGVYVGYAKFVRQMSPVLFSRLSNGEITLPEARREARRLSGVVLGRKPGPPAIHVIVTDRKSGASRSASFPWVPLGKAFSKVSRALVVA
jgi:hypothetical protein